MATHGTQNSQLHTVPFFLVFFLKILSFIPCPFTTWNRNAAQQLKFRECFLMCVYVCVCVCACVLPVGAAHCSRKKSPAWRCVCVKVHRASALRRGIFLCRGKQHARGNARKKETPACDRACVWRPCAGFWLSKKRSVLRN